MGKRLKQLALLSLGAWLYNTKIKKRSLSAKPARSDFSGHNERPDIGE